jgi:hypothetical protein
MAVIGVFWKMNSSHNDAAVFPHRNWGLRTKLIFFMIFAFTDAIHLRFVDAVYLVGAVLFLLYNLLEDSHFLWVSPKW